MSLFLMAKTVFKTLLKGPSTRKYPFGPRRSDYKNTRGSIEQDIAKCIFCGLCQRKCPAQAIIVNREKKTWTIDRFRCVTCGNCVEVCPVKCLRMENQYSAPRISKGKDIYKV